MDLFQSTRPHGARPTTSARTVKVYAFQSTRPHGARLGPAAGSCVSSCFNPRARMGRDQLPVKQVLQRHVSIHAPAWGATTALSMDNSSGTGFNPRARMGRDPHCEGLFFSSTSFNPRARMGRDTSSFSCCFSASVFQSTRPHGARLERWYARCPGEAVSIHAPAWGATALRRARPHHLRVSIHAPAWGATKGTCTGR